MAIQFLKQHNVVRDTNVSAKGAQIAGSALRRVTKDSLCLWIVTAFAAVYLFWGSTYLAIRFAIETLPPFLMAGTRFLLAGTILIVWAWQRGAAPPALIHWRTAFIVGGLMLVGGNGGVVWAEQFVPSSLAALMVATIPLLVVVIASVTRRTYPSPTVAAGVVVGLGGILLLVGPENVAGEARIPVVGAAVLMVASFSWALGTFYSRSAPQHASQFMTTGLNMVAGGLLLLVAAGLNGEYARLNLAGVSFKSWLALAYLVIFGSLIGFSAYMWLVKVTTPAQASSNFYVNPVMAVILGWLLAGEALTPRTILATAIIVGAVFLIVTHQGRQATQRQSEVSPAALAATAKSAC
ncbi:MAG TPA: EamA family transporter [Anaerolineae bacterium]